MYFTETDYELLTMPCFKTVKDGTHRFELVSKRTRTLWLIDKRIDGCALYMKSDNRYKLFYAFGTVLDAVLAIVDNDDYITKKRNFLYGRKDSFFEELVQKYGDRYSTDNCMSDSLGVA